MSDQNSKDEYSSRLVQFGFGTTAVWLLGIGLYLSTSPSRLSSLHEVDKLGSFLQGVSAPLAFFWFVVTVKLQIRELQLQREELAHTRRANELQAEELRQSVEQFSAQSELMREAQRRNTEQEIVRSLESDLNILARAAQQALISVRIGVSDKEHTNPYPIDVLSRNFDVSGFLANQQYDDAHLLIANSLDSFLNRLSMVLRQADAVPQILSGTYSTINGELYT